MPTFIAEEIISNKKQGLENSSEEISFMIDSYVEGKIPDYQISAWLMAICFSGMTDDEISHHTNSMKNSGRILDFGDTYCVDKHSTGGIGDKTSLILAPIVAALGIPVSMIAGRGLGHTGGTVDKYESLKGFNTQLSIDEFIGGIKEHQLAIIGQTDEICPADKKLYALRDVTATVDSLPLICASIMSKKIAEGIRALTLDVKYGSGAFMQTLEGAIDLAEHLKKIAEMNGLKATAVISSMNQPLGKFVGNALEVKECIEILENKTCIENGIDFYEDTRHLSLTLAAHMIVHAGKATGFDDAYKLAEEALLSGSAFEKFVELCNMQGCNNLSLKISPHSFEILSLDSGYIKAVDAKEIGVSAILLKAGRIELTDQIDHSTGIEVHFKIGQKINVGDKLFTVYAQNEDDYNEVKRKLYSSIKFSTDPAEKDQLIMKTL